MICQHSLLRHLCLITIIAGLTLTAFQPAFAIKKPDWGKVSPEEWAMTQPKDYPNAPAILLFSWGNVRVGVQELKFERYYRYKIFNRHAAEHLINVEIPVKKNEDFGGFDAQTILPNGKRLPFDSKDIMKKKIAKAFEIMSFTFPGVEDGCIIELKYNTHSNSFAMELPSWRFQDDMYTCYSQFSFTTHPAFIFNTVMIGLGDTLKAPEVEEVNIDKSPSKRFTWTLTDLPPIIDEPFKGAELNFTPSMYFQFGGIKLFDILEVSFLSDWHDLERDLTETYDAYLENNDTLSAFADSLAAAVGGVLDDQVRACVKFVKEEVALKYDDLQSLYPLQSAASTLRQRGGNPADKNLLLIKLLQELGFDANPILVPSREHARFATMILNPQQFNHVLCHVTNGLSTYVLDAADNDYPFPFLPPNLRSNGGLVLTGERMHRFSYGSTGSSSAKAVDTLKLELKEWPSGSRIQSSVWLKSDGSAACSSKVALAGYYQDLIHLIPKTASAVDSAKALLQALKDRSLDLISFTSQKSANGDTVYFDIVANISDFAVLADQNLAFVPSLALKDAGYRFEDERRQFPIDFRYPYSITETIDLHLELGTEALTFPEEIREANADWIYSRSVIKDKQSARIMTSLAMKKYYFTPDYFPKLRAFYRKIGDSLAESMTAVVH